MTTVPQVTCRCHFHGCVMYYRGIFICIIIGVFLSVLCRYHHASLVRSAEASVSLCLCGDDRRPCGRVAESSILCALSRSLH